MAHLKTQTEILLLLQHRVNSWFVISDLGFDNCCSYCFDSALGSLFRGPSCVAMGFQQWAFELAMLLLHTTPHTQKVGGEVGYAQEIYSTPTPCAAYLHTSLASAGHFSVFLSVCKTDFRFPDPPRVSGRINIMVSYSSSWSNRDLVAFLQSVMRADLPFHLTGSLLSYCSLWCIGKKYKSISLYLHNVLWCLRLLKCQAEPV